MPGQGRLGDKANITGDAHGCPGCPHPGVGPAIAGSSNVFVNGLPALRVDDVGIHAACCGGNMWKADKGAPTVFINGKAAFRLNDPSRHCGGMGKLIEGSSNVIVGDAGGAGGGGGGGGGGSGASSSSGSAAAAAGAAPAASDAAPASSPAAASEAATPTPLLVAAAWSKDKARFGESVQLRAVCDQLAGQSARFTLRDADDGHVVATLSAACGDAAVETSWTTPSAGPPHRVRFDVEAGGKSASSPVLTLVMRVELRLLLDHDGDDEPAAGRRVALLAAPSGERVAGVTDGDGKIVFEDAPSGDWKLILDEDA